MMLQPIEEDGKFHYDLVSGLPDHWQWCYSAIELQKQLKHLLKGQTLEKIYITLNEYLDGRGDGRRYFDLSFVGSYILLVFNRTAAAFAIHAEGMVEYSIFSPDQIRKEKRFDTEAGRYDPGYMHLVELQGYFDAPCSGSRVSKVRVQNTDMYGFRKEGFDPTRAGQAAEANDLPERICLFLKNGVQLQLIGDEFEYFQITVEYTDHLFHS